MRSMSDRLTDIRKRKESGSETWYNMGYAIFADVGVSSDGGVWRHRRGLAAFRIRRHGGVDEHPVRREPRDDEPD